MPELTKFDPTVYAEQLEGAVQSCENELGNIVAKAHADFHVVERAYVALEQPELIQKAARLFVQEFEARAPIEHYSHQEARLHLPSSGARYDIVLHEFSDEGVLLPPGRYRVFVAIVPIAPSAETTE